ncbi:hypothetical protein DTO164E3_1386 [Paecilomyces variotii]|uniref:Fungal calcium binding protein domain-containing protein n=1 Tax=Byssochlamys spectabilis TaxID=264951 RepID=A0A443I2D7_BYSSP|nr:hypothetical protein C8Q69DRAFT_163195 [Paecilomyces variotii]KAJ9200630.1 hypothetical protein DTO032I3_4512 [Paecilomyces variotii]KAJ9205408.1 hypothetical protein DTO164E3_1386 [Paecilomyces variotii]KAJ9245483.1 hypothetical protein DTO169E5_788 [Paecilomyces variotii]KAJ9267225.1 hypothetical protein DTO195F2_458 [Paecilomyces variotii]KAJ9270544.1 hypothetical protein DTO212C5_3333 [Paecilomyces variotii]
MYLNLSKLALVALAGTSVTAAPSSISARAPPQGADVVAKAIIHATQQSQCNVINCASVIAGAACIGLDIANEDAAGAVGCVVGGAQAMCSCMDCIDFLANFLTSHNMCPG